MKAGRGIGFNSLLRIIMTKKKNNNDNNANNAEEINIEWATLYFAK